MGTGEEEEADAMEEFNDREDLKWQLELPLQTIKIGGRGRVYKLAPRFGQNSQPFMKKIFIPANENAFSYKR